MMGLLINLPHVRCSATCWDKLRIGKTVNISCVYVLSHFGHLRLFVTLWTVACQTLLSMGFSRQEYWSGLPFPSPGDFPNTEMEPRSPAVPSFQTGSLPLSHWESPSSFKYLLNFLFCTSALQFLETTNDLWSQQHKCSWVTPFYFTTAKFKNHFDSIYIA